MSTANCSYITFYEVVKRLPFPYHGVHRTGVPTRSMNSIKLCRTPESEVATRQKHRVCWILKRNICQLLLNIY